MTRGDERIFCWVSGAVLLIIAGCCVPSVPAGGLHALGFFVCIGSGGFLFLAGFVK